MGMIFFCCTSDDPTATADGDLTAEIEATGQSAKVHRTGSCSCDIWARDDRLADPCLKAFHRGRKGGLSQTSVNIQSAHLPNAVAEALGEPIQLPEGTELDTHARIVRELSRAAKDASGAAAIAAAPSVLQPMIDRLNASRNGGLLRLPKFGPGRGAVVYFSGGTVVNIEPLPTLNSITRDHAQAVAAAQITVPAS